MAGLVKREVAGIDPASGCGRVTLRHSCFVYHYGTRAGRKVCYMFAGWFPGALDWVGRNIGAPWSLTAREVACAAEGRDRCAFEISTA